MRNQRNALIIEQEEDIRISLTQSLVKLGYDVESAQTLESGKQLISNNDYEAVFCNVCLSGRSGLELARWFQEKAKQIRFFLVARWGVEIEPIYHQTYGIEGILHAPITFAQVRGKVVSMHRCCDTGK